MGVIDSVICIYPFAPSKNRVRYMAASGYRLELLAQALPHPVAQADRSCAAYPEESAYCMPDDPPVAFRLASAPGSRRHPFHTGAACRDDDLSHPKEAGLPGLNFYNLEKFLTPAAPYSRPTPMVIRQTAGDAAAISRQPVPFVQRPFLFFSIGLIFALETIVEVVDHLDAHRLRGISLTPTAGLGRRDRLRSDGNPLRVPVGKTILGRIFNVFGQLIDGFPPPENTRLRSIHQRHIMLSEMNRGVFQS